MADKPTLPSEDEALSWVEKLSNWGRWGPDDQRGTLNFITDEKRLEALQLVRRGRSVSFAWDIDTGPPGPDVKAPPQRYMTRSGESIYKGDETIRQVAAAEYIGLIFHGRRITHLDALAHVFWNGKLYNGFPASNVSTEFGAQSHAVTVAREGIITRGLMIDAPRHRGVEWLESGTPVQRDEVEAILAANGVEPRQGDALLLRTGYGRYRLENGPEMGRNPGRLGRLVPAPLPREQHRADSGRHIPGDPPRPASRPSAVPFTASEWRPWASGCSTTATWSRWPDACDEARSARVSPSCSRRFPSSAPPARR